MESHELTRLLLDQDRLAVAGALAVRPMTTEELIGHIGCDRRTVLSAIGDLRSAGLVGVDGNRYRLDAEILRRAARESAEIEVPMDPIIGYGMTHDEQAILARCFSGRTLVSIPSSRAKRRVVLERLAQEFDVGRRYTERQVNDTLRRFHTDTASLRRHLVDEGLLDRSPVRGNTEYWRSGGRVLGV